MCNLQNDSIWTQSDVYFDYVDPLLTTEILVSYLTDTGYIRRQTSPSISKPIEYSITGVVHSNDKSICIVSITTKCCGESTSEPDGTV